MDDADPGGVCEWCQRLRPLSLIGLCVDCCDAVDIQIIGDDIASIGIHGAWRR